MNECARDELERARERLAQVHAEVAAAADERGRALLDQSTQAWDAYREAECDRQNDPYREGTIYPLLYASCRASLTRQRSDQLASD